MCEKLLHFILGIRCFNFLKQSTKLKAWVSRCIQNSLELWEPYPELLSRGGFEETKVSENANKFVLIADENCQ